MLAYSVGLASVSILWNIIHALPGTLHILQVLKGHGDQLIRGMDWWVMMLLSLVIPPETAGVLNPRSLWGSA